MNATTSPLSSLDLLTPLLVPGRRFMLGLVGAPGAGKSTVAQALCDALPGRAVVVPMDGFHLANSELLRMGRRDRKGAADTFDSAGYVALLGRLRQRPAGQVVYAPDFRRELDEAVAGAIAVPDECELVITEGNYLLLDDGHWAGVRQQLDAVWYVDIDAKLRRERLVARHMRFGRSEAAARDWVLRTDEPNALLVEATRPRADVVLR
ncbi:MULTISPECIES: nucleoside/nucleotide kinase family protein [unclassified Janthinobacterium]|uniref:nucleoside/nucleotide kinase family protein n=1 Tax=unclassified Janthinobacterium TaxID=2610881 RepID=UPI000345732E|nr:MULTISPECIES: nucleoside/nucleotide kinase family protein [unclassified Janthinobacterium]MEC5159489.1 pantothenate kinase [Janthinobacterium sp. CG_S6]